jgi:hypothetical protein
MSLRVPDFNSETEEADWWYEHRAEVEADFLLAFAEGRLQQRTGLESFVDLPPQTVSPDDLREATELLRSSGIWNDDASEKSVESFNQAELRKAS